MSMSWKFCGSSGPSEREECFAVAFPLHTADAGNLEHLLLGSGACGSHSAQGGVGKDDVRRDVRVAGDLAAEGTEGFE